MKSKTKYIIRDSILFGSCFVYMVFNTYSKFGFIGALIFSGVIIPLMLIGILSLHSFRRRNKEDGE